MRRGAKKALYNVLYCVVVIGIALCIWSIAAAVIGSEFVLPNLRLTFGAFGSVLKNTAFWSGLCGTLLRSVIGFAISLALFFVLFYFSAVYDGFRKIVEPLISALRSMPAVAVTLVLALVVGGFGTPIVLGVLVIMPIMYSAARARTATVPTELAEICRLYGANKRQTFSSVWFPCLAGALPETLSTAFSYNIKAVIGAEILAQTADSLGVLMKIAQQYYETAMLIAFVVIAVVIAIVLEALLRGVLKICLRKYAD